MKQKTKKRLKSLIRPICLGWASLAFVIALIGATIKSLAYLMVGNWTGCKKQFTDKF